jgi:hypothetical protein
VRLSEEVTLLQQLGVVAIETPEPLGIQHVAALAEGSADEALNIITPKKRKRRRAVDAE